MTGVRKVPSGLLFLGLAVALAPTARAAQVDIELFAPARDAAGAIQAARRARAAELAPNDMRLADLYNADATAALQPPAGPPDVEKATRLFRLAAAQARVAETRSIEIVRQREAAAAGNEYLDAIEGDPKRMLPARPPLPQAGAEYRARQRDAADARAARRRAEEELDKLLSRPR